MIADAVDEIERRYRRAQALAKRKDRIPALIREFDRLVEELEKRNLREQKRIGFNGALHRQLCAFWTEVDADAGTPGVIVTQVLDKLFDFGEVLFEAKRGDIPEDEDL